MLCIHYVPVCWYFVMNKVIIIKCRQLHFLPNLTIIGHLCKLGIYHNLRIHSLHSRQTPRGGANIFSDNIFVSHILYLTTVILSILHSFSRTFLHILAIILNI
jgi:hypothetical protein